VLVFCDLTIDAPVELSEEEQQEKENRSSRFRSFAAKQKELIEELTELIKRPNGDIKQDDLVEMHEKIRHYDTHVFQGQLMALHTIEKEEKAENSWSFLGIFKKLLGIIMLLSILKMIVFPAAAPPTEAELLKEAQSRI